MGIYGHIWDKYKVQNDILLEVQFTQNTDPLRIDAYIPKTFEKSLVGSTRGAYMEIYTNKYILRVNVCYGWIITNHTAKMKLKVCKNPDINMRRNIQNLLSRVDSNGFTMYQNILKFFQLPEDWIMPNFLNMFPEPADSVKDKLENEAWKALEDKRKKEAELERKRQLAMKYNNYKY